MTVRILAFAGSSRKQSFNRQLLAVAAEGARQAGGDVTLIDLADFPMPLFNQDEEAAQGMPEHARRFKRLLIEHDAFLIASPEYNSAFSPLLKNVIDWASRAETDDEPPLQAYRGKYAAIMSASPGGLGGMRGLVFLRMLLANIGVTVLADQQTLPGAGKAFDDHGVLIDDAKRQAVAALGEKLVTMVARLRKEE